MPIYSFKCKLCSESFDELVSFSELQGNEKEIYSCPKCGSPHTEKQLTTPAFGFKGGSPSGEKSGIV